MNLDDLEREVLCAARREMTPAGDTAARVHAAALERIALTAAEHTAAVGSSAGSAGLATVAKVGLAVVIGGVGLAAALSRSDPSPASPVPQRAVARASSVTSSAPPTVITAEVAEPAEPSPEAGTEPPPPSRPRVRSRRGAASTQPSEQRLAEEVRLLGAAERALRARNPDAAAKALAKLERTVPGGKLGEERTAARVLTECLRRPGKQARAAARTFLAQEVSINRLSGKRRE